MLIGAKLRAARKLRSLTLDQVALSAGLTKGFVSRLERDDVSPSVASLVAVCDVLGLRVGELFDPPVTSVSRAGEGRLINFGGEGAVETPRHAGHAERARGHPLRDRAGRQRWRRSSTPSTSEVECAYVLSGTIEVVLQHGPETLAAATR